MSTYFIYTNDCKQLKMPKHGHKRVSRFIKKTEQFFYSECSALLIVCFALRGVDLLFSSAEDGQLRQGAFAAGRAVLFQAGVTVALAAVAAVVDGQAGDGRANGEALLRHLVAVWRALLSRCWCRCNSRC